MVTIRVRVSVMVKARPRPNLHEPRLHHVCRRSRVLEPNELAGGLARGANMGARSKAVQQAIPVKVDKVGLGVRSRGRGRNRDRDRGRG